MTLSGPQSLRIHSSSTLFLCFSLTLFIRSPYYLTTMLCHAGCTQPRQVNYNHILPACQPWLVYLGQGSSVRFFQTTIEARKLSLFAHEASRIGACQLRQACLPPGAQSGSAGEWGWQKQPESREGDFPTPCFHCPSFGVVLADFLSSLLFLFLLPPLRSFPLFLSWDLGISRPGKGGPDEHNKSNLSAYLGV